MIVTKSPFVAAYSLLAATVLTFPTVSVGAIIIDDFSVAPTTLELTTKYGRIEEVQRNLDPSHVIGGQRNISLRAQGPPYATAFTRKLKIDTSVRELQFNQVNQGVVEIVYGRDSPLNLNIRGMVLAIDIFGDPYRVVNMSPSLYFYSEHGGAGTHPWMDPFTVRSIPGGGTRLQIDVREFNEWDDWNPSAVTYFYVAFHMPHTRVGRLAFIPEPSSMAMMVLGGAMCGFRAKPRRAGTLSN